MEERLNFSNTPLFNTILRKQAPIEHLLFDKGLPNHCTYRESTEVSLGAKLKAHSGSILRSPGVSALHDVTEPQSVVDSGLYIPACDRIADAV